MSEFVGAHADCAEMVPLLHARSRGGTAPVWVDVPIKVRPDLAEGRSAPSHARRSVCVAELARLMRVRTLLSSTHRASPSVSHLIW